MKRLGASTALGGVAVEVDGGEALALRGVDGAVKTTLIKCMNGGHRRDSGSIEMDGVPVELKTREYDLALFLFQNMGRLLSRDHLREIIWGQTSDVISRSLDTHISRLRSQLDLRPDNGYIVTAVYGMGYRFEAVKPKSEVTFFSI